jgi:hypothetical protein
VHVVMEALKRVGEKSMPEYDLGSNDNSLRSSPRVILRIYSRLSSMLAHTTIDWRELGIPSALPYISFRSVD